ncbi:MAG: polymer-forming cytoskeletal protein [Acidobacteria bacterium]|jgi:cytoskeletal protein CcmA (bactofilin family)|nr:polymer-forming cytoskeletal protein [Acidobacteriota bacterium]
MAVFSQKKNEEPAQVPAAAISQSTLVGKTLRIKGEVYSEDEMLIEGRIQGTITVKNRLTIGSNGDVEAEIDAREVIIKGKVTGNVRGSQRVEIVPAGTLHGNILAPRVVIADSGFFEGNIEMRPRDEKRATPGADKPAAAASGGAPTPASQGGEHPTPQKPTHK